MRAMKWVIHGLCLFLMCASVAQTHGQDVRKAVLLKTADWPEKLVNELSKKFKSDCPKYDITSDQNHFDYSIVTGHGLAVYDKSGQIVSWSDASSLSSQIKDICWSLETATVVEVVDADNLTQTSDLRGAPPAGGIAGVANEIAGRRRTHTDNATLDVIAKGEHAVLDCYEHHKGCTTIAAGKYYAAIYDGSIWISYEMPITHEHKRNHYVIAGSW